MAILNIWLSFCKFWKSKWVWPGNATILLIADQPMAPWGSQQARDLYSLKGKSSNVSNKLILSLQGNFSYFLSSADIFQIQLFFFKFSECLTVWIQIRSDIFSGLIWVQTVCKGYQQTTLAGKVLNNRVFQGKSSMISDWYILSCRIMIWPVRASRMLYH